eukprot:m.172908 g.172908  ORF g.172908 m.172908 type:complete len:324 (-) comp18293_c0_seq2:551-1522(-)
MATPSLRTSLIQRVVLTLDKLGSAGTTSTFQKTGKLTPDEFVRAGDFLVENFPTWQWCAGLPEKARSHLPADKQFLVTRDVPCLPPPNSAAGQADDVDRMIEGDDGEDSWVDTGAATDDAAELAGEVAELDVGAGTGGEAEDEDIDDDDLDDVASLDGFDYDDDAVKDQDDAALSTGAGAGGTGAAGDGNDNVVQTRTYDVSVTYDTYYSTPRVWLFGYDASHDPLTGDAWQSDFSPEHLNKTVTFESHTHLGFSCPSIHPCKHAAAMLKMISLAVGGQDGALDVKFYLLIFLKFIQTIIPNIEYDYTGQFQIGASAPRAAEK